MTSHFFYCTGLSPSKTVWSTVSTTWSGQRKVLNVIGGSDVALEVELEMSAVERNLFTTQPNWCFFQGVTCASGSPSIESINLSGLGLIGSLPDSISNYRALTSFDVSHNSLTGTIPKTISTWYYTIVNIKMNNNMFIGSIPSTIGPLTKLNLMTLNNNMLTGTIPTQMSLLVSLFTLKLSYNFLTMGTLSTVPVSTFSSFTASSPELDLSNNCLTYRYAANYPTNTVGKFCRPTGQPTSRKCTTNIYARLQIPLHATHLIPTSKLVSATIFTPRRAYKATNRSTKWATNGPTDWATYRSANRSTYQPADWSANTSTY